MPSFPRPALLDDWTPVKDDEIAALHSHRSHRGIPDKADDRLLLATWNIANFDVQGREPVHLELLAEILSWFDLVALQEMRDDVGALRRLKEHLPDSWRVLFSETGGNDERQAFLWNGDRVQLGDKVGKLTVPYTDLGLAFGNDFQAFDRTPYIASFHCGDLALLLICVHSVWGSGETAMPRRKAETRAIARWCDMRRKDDNAYTKDIIALGDFNMPKAAPGDPIFTELVERGLKVPQYETRIGTDRARAAVEGTTISSESQYDQFVIVPEHTGVDIVDGPGVFDFDAVLFADLWENRLPWHRPNPTGQERKRSKERQKELDFDAYARWAISDHRPVWIQLKTA